MDDTGPQRARAMAGRVARRTPGVRGLVRRRDDARSQRQGHEQLEQQHDQTRRELEAERKKTSRQQARIARLKQRQDRAQRRTERLKNRMNELNVERREGKQAVRELRRWREAAQWGDTEGQTDGSGPVALNGLRTRLSAAAVVEALEHGEDLSTVLVRYAQTLAELPQYPFRYRIPALVEALGGVDGVGPAAHAALAVHGHRSEHADFARHHLEQCGDETAARLIPVEFARIRLEADPTAAPAVVSALRQHAALTPEGWLDVMSAISATGDLTALVTATDTVAAESAGWTVEDQQTLAGFVRYASRAGVTAEPQPADVTFGVMGYHRPDLRLASRNIGDYTQTLGAVSHVLRHTDLRLGGDPELVEVMESLRSRIRPDLRIPGTDASVALVEVCRDDSPLDLIPPDTWYIAFGWHLHPDTLGTHGLPYHPNLRPVFVSFHCNRWDMLSEEAVEYLRQHAPIGCRDWYTVDILTHRGVPAFFTGCVTTTVDGYFEDRTPAVEGPTGYVDSRPPKGEHVIHQAYPEVRQRTVATNLRTALDTLDEYRRDYASLVTGRLHCHLPATSIGIPTEFRPKRDFDVRFEGLTDEHADLEAMRHRIRHTLLEPVLGAILSGSPADDVYALWRSITEPLVAADAKARDDAFDWPTTSPAVEAAVPAIRGAAWSRERTEPASDAPAIDLCVALDRNYLNQLYTVLNRVLERTSRPVRLWVLARELEQADFAAFADAFPELTVTFLPCDDVEYGERVLGSARITVSTMDRLLLPDLLGEVDKLLYIDLDLLPRADLGELYDVPLDGAPLAARPSQTTKAIGSVRSFADLAHRQLDDGPDVWRLLNLVHRRGGAGAVGFNAGVMVMDLKRMREDDFVRRYVGFAEQFFLNDQFVVNLYAGSSYRQLDARWNAWPGREVLDDPSLVHWVGPFKPWDALLTEFKDDWEAAEAAMLARRGFDVPPGG